MKTPSKIDRKVSDLIDRSIDWIEATTAREVLATFLFAFMIVAIPAIVSLLMGLMGHR